MIRTPEHGYFMTYMENTINISNFNILVIQLKLGIYANTNLHIQLLRLEIKELEPTMH